MNLALDRDICNRLSTSINHYVGTSYSQFKIEYYEEDEDDEDTEDETGYKSFVIKRRNCKVTRI